MRGKALVEYLDGPNKGVVARIDETLARRLEKEGAARVLKMAARPTRERKINRREKKTAPPAGKDAATAPAEKGE